MPKIEGGYVNPFYQEVDKEVSAELNERSRIYGARVRSTRKQAEKFPNDLVWAYQKVAFAQIIPEKGPSLGMAFSKIMSNRKGELTLYDSTRNQPKYPLLQSVEISNEGTIGSLLKGKFTFTVYPDITKQGFKMADLEEAYFKPGREVTIRWGWSAKAANKKANYGELRGIIYNFDWSVNGDLSITATCSVVSKATIAIGVSGEQTNPESDTETEDPLNKPVPDGDIAGLIEKDIAELNKGGSVSMSLGQKRFYGRDQTESGKKLNPNGLQYFVIGLPKSDKDAQGTDANSDKSTPPPVIEPTYYIKLGDLTELVNGLIRKSEEGGVLGVSDLFYVVCNGNQTEHLPDIVSCAPEQVFFPDPTMGKYGNFIPFKTEPLLTMDSDGTTQLDSNTINIGNILISTTTIIESYRQFVKDNQTNIEFKNITKFFETIISKINYASGETYQLSCRLLEPEQLQGGTKGGMKSPRTGASKAILSIEDNNLSRSAVEEVTPYEFNSSIAKPIIKSVSISSKPPGPAATAAYAEARASKSGKGLGPQQGDVRTAQNKEIDEDKFKKQYDEALDAINKVKDSFASTGASDKFTTDLKGNYAKYKRAAQGGAAGSGGHWLNRAIYPVDLTLTIDGINGFKFGDIIKINLIPSTYNLEEVDMVFCITKVSHTIRDGVWETKLETKSRINMGKSPPVSPK